MLVIRIITIAGIVLAICFQLYWFFVTNGKKERRKKAKDRFKIIRGAFGITSICLSAFFILANSRQSSVSFIAYFIICCGIILRLWSQITLGANWSVSIAVRREHKLIMVGPYQFIRHPMYTSYFLFAIGTFFCTLNFYLLIIWSIFLLFVIARARAEERLLSEIFGDMFLKYKGRVGMFLPKLFRI